MKIGILLITLMFGLSWAQEFTLTVTKVYGSVQIKREGSRRWEELKTEDEIFDNGIIRTSFRSNCEIRAGRDNIIYMGANSRILINAIEKAGTNNEINVTVFAGSVYSKTVSGIDYYVYSSTAVGKTQEGIFNCTVDEATGISGFHVFKGTITTSNISVQWDQILRAGDMSSISRDTRPTKPKKISAKQMAFLTRFYGAEFINQEIEATGVEVVTGTGTTATEYSAIQESEESWAGLTKRPRPGKGLQLFDHEDIIQKLEDHREKTNWMYAEVSKSDLMSHLKYRVTSSMNHYAHHQRSFLDFYIRPGYFLKNAHIVLNLPFVSDSSGDLGMGSVGSGRGLLDKIYSIGYQYKKSFIYIGDIDHFTVNYGLVMKDYSNRAYSDNIRNVGAVFHLESYFKNLEVFTASLANFHLYGANFFLEDTLGYIGIAAIREEGQAINLNGGDYTFRSGDASLSDTLPEDSLVAEHSLTFAEINFARNIFYVRPIKVQAYLGLAGMIMNDEANLKGFTMNLPGLEVIWGRQVYRAEIFINRNRFIRGFFNKFYEDNSFVVRRGNADSNEVTATTNLAEELVKEKFKLGINLAFKLKPIRGLTVSAEFEKDLAWLEADTSRIDANTGMPVNMSSGPGRNNGRLDLRIKMGEKLYRRISFAEAYYQISHCGYYSNSSFSPFFANTFTTFGARLFFLITGNIECFAGFEKFFYDRNGDFEATSDEGVTGISAGVTVGF
jgi:hypothetical protein